MKHLLPFLHWPRPDATLLRSEALAGLTVGLMVLPQGVAYAALAGMPLETGIYASMLPALIAVLFSEGEACYLEGRGLPVGLFEEASYNDLVMQLPPSFSLSMMSDGILDLLPGDTLKEKEAALPRLVSEAGGTLDGLRQVFGLANLRDMPDDIALLVLSRNLA